MPLAPGTWLNQYEILSLLGVGGMGEVYHARDSKLTREVALKLLPKIFANDPERLARFRREAQLLAQLNHPNIAAIYNFETSGETHFLVLEYVPGETLRERIKRGPVAVEESLDICEQICGALEHAHEKTIIHRDLKPANVKVKPDGQVKVLDFGLAKAFAAEAPPSDPGDAPTLHASPTLPGVILGTAAYMSPQQARGKSVDKRADIWALGCVLYELLTGQQAFQSRDREEGGTLQDILARVLEGEPDWTALPANTPHSVRVLLRRCLEKDPKRRFRDAADLEIQLEEAAPARAPSMAAAIAPPPAWRRLLPWGVAAVLSIAVGLAVWTLRPALPPQPVSRVVIPLPPNEQLAGTYEPMVALSPDGTQLVYVGSGSGVLGGIALNSATIATSSGGLYLRAMDSLDAKPLGGTEGASNPFFSPDGQWIGFFARGQLKKVSVSGGATLTLANVSTPNGADWGPNDPIVFNPAITEGIWQVSAAGGEPQKLTTLKEGEISHRWPHFLPAGNAVLFSIPVGTPQNGNIAVIKLDTKEQKVLIRGGTFPRYVPTGHLVYYRDGTMMAVPFDADRLEITGTPVPVLEGVMPTFGPNTGGGQFSFSSQGSLVYIPGNAQASEFTLAWVDRKGTETPLPAPLRAYDDPRLSPDGQQVAVQIVGPPSEIWTYDISRATLTRLTFMGTANFPLWTPDGRRIVYTMGGRTERNNGLFWKAADGSGSDESLLSSETSVNSSSISPDGKALAYTLVAPNTGNDIWILPLEGDPRQAGAEGRKPKPFLQAPFNQDASMFSPDGRWIAYVSDESGRNEIYVQPYPGPGGKWQISTDGGTQPVWARNGRELFYLNGAKMMAVEIATQPSFRPGTPQMLFERPELQMGAQPGTRADYDVSPDGQRFLVLKAKEQPQATLTQIHVVLNWFEELKRRVPTK